MSLVPFGDTKSVGFWMEDAWEAAPQFGVTLGMMVLAAVSLRGAVSLAKDLVSVAKKMLVGVKVDAETQTEESGFQLPMEVWFNPQSGVYHIDGCRHIGSSAVAKRACTICRNVG